MWCDIGKFGRGSEGNSDGAENKEIEVCKFPNSDAKCGDLRQRNEGSRGYN